MSSLDVVTRVFNALKEIVESDVKTLSGDTVRASLGYPNTKLSETGSLPAVVIVQVTPSFIEPLGFGNIIVTTGSQWFDIFSGSARNHLGVRIIFSAQVDTWARQPRERNFIAGQILESLVYPSSKSSRDFYEITGSRSPQIRAGILISQLKSMHDIDNRATNVTVELPVYQKEEAFQVYRKVMSYKIITEFQWNVFEPLIGSILVGGNVTGSVTQVIQQALWATITGSEEIRY